VKVNYGSARTVQKIFPELPAGYDSKSAASHFDFWKGKDVPDSWKNSRILHCFGLLKEWMDFVMTWPKWFPMSSELYELSDKNAKHRFFY
jgi:hypothetical protein